MRKGAWGDYDIKVSLLDSGMKELAERSSISLNGRCAPSPDGSWERLALIFMNYSPGLRFIGFEDSMTSNELGGPAYDVKAVGATVKVYGRA